jgi:hypothetical protein
MKITKAISEIDAEIIYREKIIAELRRRKEQYSNLEEQFPNAHYQNGAICLEGIWDKISCMRIERPNSYYHSYNITTKFLIGKKDTIDGMKLHLFPLHSPIATVNTTYNQITKVRTKTITVLDYNVIIDDSCPKKKTFMRRLKLYLANTIANERLILDEKSFNYDEINKLLLLK